MDRVIFSFQSLNPFQALLIVDSRDFLATRLYVILVLLNELWERTQSRFQEALVWGNAALIWRKNLGL